MRSYPESCSVRASWSEVVMVVPLAPLIPDAAFFALFSLMSPRVTLAPGLDSEKSLAMMDPIFPDPRTMTFMGFNLGLLWWLRVFHSFPVWGNYFSFQCSFFERWIWLPFLLWVVGRARLLGNTVNQRMFVVPRRPTVNFFRVWVFKF